MGEKFFDILSIVSKRFTITYYVMYALKWEYSGIIGICLS